jgi:hypothetical protein
MTEAQDRAVERAILLAIFDGERSANFLADLDEVVQEATSPRRSGQVYALPALHDLESR